MVLVTTNWRIWLAGMAASLAIFAVIFFTEIQPSTNTANQLLKSGLQQTQQAIKQVQSQAGAATGQAGAATGQAAAATGQAGAVTGQARQQLSKAEKLTTCVTAAGTNVTQIQACQAKYAN
jgi:hypothetical protein